MSWVESTRSAFYWHCFFYFVNHYRYIVSGPHLVCARSFQKVFGCAGSVVVVTGGALFVTFLFSLCGVVDVSILVMFCVIFLRRIRF